MQPVASLAANGQFQVNMRLVPRIPLHWNKDG